MRSKLLLLCLVFLFIPCFVLAQAKGGIGVILEYLPDKKVHRVRAVFQGSPAARAKIQAGDEIVSIDGQNTDKMN